MHRDDRIWQNADVATDYLEGTRGAMPLAAAQFDIMLRVMRKALPDATDVKRFLDIGCGDGVMGAAVLSQYPDAEGVFLDFSETMLDAARAKLGNNPKHTFISADYGKPEWLDEVQPHAPFDVIVSGYSIHHQPDARKRAIYREIHDLLTPGGVFLNMEHVAPTDDWVESLFNDLFIDSMYGYEQQIGSGKTYEQVYEAFLKRVHKDANILAPVETQCEWLREFGFEHVDCYLKIYELALFGGVKRA